MKTSVIAITSSLFLVTIGCAPGSPEEPPKGTEPRAASPAEGSGASAPASAANAAPASEKTPSAAAPAATASAPSMPSLHASASTAQAAAPATVAEGAPAVDKKIAEGATPVTAKPNNAEPAPVTTSSGLQYVDLVAGTGPSPTVGKKVNVHYTGWLTNGTKFDSSVDRGQPFSFVLGVGQVIRGWDEGVASMKVGGKRKLTIPPTLGYGARGAGGVIPPNATLVFEVELLGVQ